MLDVLRFVAKGRRLNFQFRRWVEDYQGRDGVSRIVTVVHWNSGDDVMGVLLDEV